MPICNECSVFEENEDVEGWRAGRSVEYCEACEGGEGGESFPKISVPIPFSAQITVRDLLLIRFATCWRALF